MAMFVVLQREICFVDYSGPETKPYLVAPGKYEVERITSPRNTGVPWLVFKGTKAGTDEAQWRQWDKPELGAHRVEIIDDSVEPLPAA